jgi:hypothetical protein
MNNWVAVKEVRKKSAVRGNALAMLEAIARHINHETGTAFVGRERIAALVGCHPDNVRKYRRVLEKLGELETDIQGGPGKSKRDKPNLYCIPFLTDGVDSPPEQLCIGDGVRRRGEFYYPYRQQDTDSRSSGGDKPTVTDRLKESSVYELFGGAAGEVQFANLDPSNPELELLRRELVGRTGSTPPPGFDPRMTREEAAAKLHDLLGAVR